MVKFSVIMQSYLGYYDRAASNRETKIIRAIDSVLNQSYKNYELLIIADGCEKTFDIVSDNYIDNKKVNCFLIQKQPIWSGSCRNFGISKAIGEWIVYLDIDDYLGENHLKIIESQLSSYDWVWFNDYIIDPSSLNPIERTCIINKKFGNGTANIAHKKSLPVMWSGLGYGLDDWSLVQNLLAYKNNRQISTPQYYVAHLPGRVDV